MIFLENSGSGRRYRFHGAFGSVAAAERKEAATPGAFIRETTMRGATRYVVMSPKTGARNTPSRRPGKSAPFHPSEVRMARRSHSRKRKGAARRSRRRSHSRGVALASNPPARRRRRGGRTRSTAARRTHRRGARRNPPGGIVGALKDAVVDGLFVTGGDIAQNAIARYMPSLVPATVAGAATINAAIGDVVGIVAGAMFADKGLGRDRARFFVAGQAYAAIARQLRAANVPVVSTMLGEYDPIKLGIYTSGVSGVTARRTRRIMALPPGPATASNVATLKSVGIYSDGMSLAPSIF